MAYRKIVAALAAAALVAAPTMGVAQTAAQAPAPAAETVDGSELRGGNGFGQVLPLLFIIALVLLIREIVKDRDVGDDAISP